MHREADYAKEYESDMASLRSGEELTPEQKEILHEDMRKIIEIADISDSQFKKVLNAEQRSKILALYDMLDLEALATGSRISLDMDDNRMVADLYYTGNLICKTGTGDDQMAQAMVFLSLESDMFQISANADKTFTIHAVIDYYDQIQVADRSEELKEKRKRLKEWNAVKWNDVPEPEIK